MFLKHTETKYIQVPSNKALEQLSFTHFLELIKIDDPLKRAFYEIETIRGTRTTRQLKRQIGSLLFERTGLSNNKTKLLEITHQQTIQYIICYVGLFFNPIFQIHLLM